MSRRIELHAAARSLAVAVPEGFRLARGLFTDDERRVAAARSGRHGGRLHIGESSGSGLDPEVGSGRIFPRKIVSAHDSWFPVAVGLRSLSGAAAAV
jgi:hypothetical protein